MSDTVQVKNKTGIAPIIDWERGFRYLSYDELYTDEIGSTGRIVPNVNDAVWSWTKGLFRVVAIDPDTLLSTLQPFQLDNLRGGVTVEDVMLATGAGQQTEAFRIYVNTSVVPYTLSFDSRLEINGSNASYIKLFRGDAVNLDGEVISAIINSSNIQISENIPLELIQLPQGSNVAKKTPKLGHVTKKLNNNEMCTCVVYSASGQVLSIYRVLVVLSNFVRSIDSSKKRITDITLLSPYLSVNNNRLIEIPVNMTVDTLPLTVKVTYNNGQPVELPISNKKVSLFGMDNYISSEVGLHSDLVLTYTLGADEYSDLTQGVQNRHFITKDYQIVTVDADNLYNVKLFIVPWWSTTTNSYQLDYYLYSLERSTVLKVNNYIEIGATSASFNGKLFGQRQDMRVSINLANVSPRYVYAQHVISFGITLNQPATNEVATGYYLLEYAAGAVVGANMVANVNVQANGLFELGLSQGYTSSGGVLDVLYWNTEPLYYPYGEGSAPEPTHVRIKIGANWSRTITVDEIQSAVSNIDAPPADMVQGKLVRLEFIKQTKTQVLELATVGLIIKR